VIAGTIIPPSSRLRIGAGPRASAAAGATATARITASAQSRAMAAAEDRGEEGDDHQAVEEPCQGVGEALEPVQIR
jgi:hypothetical protein